MPFSFERRHFLLVDATLFFLVFLHVFMVVFLQPCAGRALVVKRAAPASKVKTPPTPRNCYIGTAAFKPGNLDHLCPNKPTDPVLRPK